MFVRLAYFRGASRSSFEALADRMADASAPPGRLLFAAGPVDGGWHVVQVWESRAQLDQFNRAVFLPALADLGGQAFPHPPEVTDFEPELWSHTPSS